MCFKNSPITHSSNLVEGRAKSKGRAVFISILVVLLNNASGGALGFSGNVNLGL